MAKQYGYVILGITLLCGVHNLNASEMVEIRNKLASANDSINTIKAKLDKATRDGAASYELRSIVRELNGYIDSYNALANFTELKERDSRILAKQESSTSFVNELLIALSCGLLGIKNQ